MDNFKKENKALVESLIALGILKTPKIIDAFLKIPRHLFVPEKYLANSYLDIALPTLANQTISQPYTVATMLEALSPDDGDNVLDIGSGSGWTACLLTKIIGKKGKVTGIDIDLDLVQFAKKNISKTRLEDIEIILGDGKKGYPQNSPYDCILINAACNGVPGDVRDQLKLFGRLVAPINTDDHQEMILFQKVDERELSRTSLGNYVFVKLK